MTGSLTTCSGICCPWHRKLRRRFHPLIGWAAANLSAASAWLSPFTSPGLVAGLPLMGESRSPDGGRGRASSPSRSWPPQLSSSPSRRPPMSPQAGEVGRCSRGALGRPSLPASRRLPFRRLGRRPPQRRGRSGEGRVRPCLHAASFPGAPREKGPPTVSRTSARRLPGIRRRGRATTPSSSSGAASRFSTSGPGSRLWFFQPGGGWRDRLSPSTPAATNSASGRATAVGLSGASGPWWARARW